MQPKAEISWGEFAKIDMRVGCVQRAEVFPEARKPAIKLWLDFGPDVGIRKTSAQITDHYQPQDLIGRHLVAVVNFPSKQIGNFMSECLVLGAIEENGAVMLLSPHQHVPPGQPIA